MTRGSRSILHINKLPDFIAYLDSKSIPHRDGKGEYEVIQVRVGKGWAAIHKKLEAREHYTVPEKLLPLVTDFIKECGNKTRHNIILKFWNNMSAEMRRTILVGMDLINPDELRLDESCYVNIAFDRAKKNGNIVELINVIEYMLDDNITK